MVVNQVILVGTIVTNPHFIDAAKDTAEVKTLLFDIDSGYTHIHHCAVYEELARRGHEEDDLKLGDLIYVRGRIEGRRMVSQNLDDLGEWVYVAVEDYTLLTEWARQRIRSMPEAL